MNAVARELFYRRTRGGRGPKLGSAGDDADFTLGTEERLTGAELAAALRAIAMARVPHYLSWIAVPEPGNTRGASGWRTPLSL